MELYQEIDRRRAHRAARRQAERERKERHERLLSIAKTAIQFLAGTAIVLMYIHYGFAWAGI